MFPEKSGAMGKKIKTDEKLLETVGVITITLSMSDGAERLVYLVFFACDTRENSHSRPLSDNKRDNI